MLLPTTDFRVGLLLALRARLFSTLFGLIAAMLLVVWMAAQFSGRQPATVALDVGLSFIRIALPVLMILLVQELISREFDRRYYLSSLTYPRPRHQLLLGRFAAVMVILLGGLVLMSTTLSLEVWLIGKNYNQATPVALDYRYLITLAFILLDFFTLTAMATLLAVSASTPSFVLIGTVGFLLIARSYASIIALLKSESYLVASPDIYQGSLGILGYLIPDLGALDVRMIALYGKISFLPEQWPILLLSVTTYAFALIMFSLWLLNRKRLS